MRKKALLLSAYDAQSHQHWHQVLTNGVTEYEWTVISLPARHFYWRVRSNALSFALEYNKPLRDEYDVLIATSMVDLATLRGLVPELAQVPALVYFHENQFNYPQRDAATEHRINNAQFCSIVTALCADRILFNSDYNRRSFLSGVKSFIKRMPDGLPSTIPDHIQQKSAVLPVPIHAKPVIQASENFIGLGNDYDKKNNTADVVWAHRWEYDKQPEVFFNALEILYDLPEFIASQIDIRLHVMGQSFREIPDCFRHAKNRGIHKIVTWGYQSREEYLRILSNSDFVISTALHDFQGLAMIEAIHHGCIPLAPNRVAYPEYIPKELLYEVKTPQKESGALAIKLCQQLCARQNKNTNTPQLLPEVSSYLDDQLISKYQAEISALIVGKIQK